MKKKILVLFLSIVTGAILAITTLITMDIKQRNKQEKTELYVLQLGSFHKKENAQEKKAEYPESVILKDGESYVVLLGASTSESAINKMEQILKEKNTTYYKKKIEVYLEDLELLQKYNLLLEQAKNEETVIFLNQKILERVKTDVLFN